MGRLKVCFVVVDSLYWWFPEFSWFRQSLGYFGLLPDVFLGSICGSKGSLGFGGSDELSFVGLYLSYW